MENLDYPPLCASLTVRDAAAAIAFYEKAFGAKELYRLMDPQNGKVGHAELSLEGSILMVSDEYPEFNKAPDAAGVTSVRLCHKVDDVDAVFQRALDAGAESVRPPADQFYGHRSGCLRDPFGHEWMLFFEKERVSPEEMQRRWNSMAKDA